ncbi:hypothetical protein [Sphingomonas sp. S2-65]|uniref:hypothetical protein n=1 Tax=Sphingomonas sp. S2-65 TaxID=2903960 RepID=UPI001F4821E6|nr:hypothetical protein [Sphingomonas sp. S2-65]UYY58023.1 hypothetical protein LZ586_15365 [Sphingomonas sp. S2-65]
MASGRSRTTAATGTAIAVTSKRAGTRRIGNYLVPVEAVFHVPRIAPAARGPWNAEAEKVAWWDEMSGYGCIIRRSAKNGALAGFVGVGPDHPLFNFDQRAIESLGVRIHGGVNYSWPCQESEPEWRSVCHVGDANRRGQVTARLERTFNQPFRHDEMWWVGFSCDQPDDILPNDKRDYAVESALDGLSHRIYRDEAFVYEQCVYLAAQFKAIADNRDPAEVPAPSTTPATKTER